MKKLALALALLVAFAAPAEVVSFSQLWDNQATNTTTFFPISGGDELQVTVIGNSTPDGTVTIYTCPQRVVASCVVVSTYATPTTAKTFVGTSQPFVYVTLTGNTTGNVDLLVVLKR